MHDLGRNEDRLRGTYEFPFEFHHIDSTHPRYVMSYHWHVECEIMRILQGTLTVTLDEKSFTAKAGDVIFVNSGVLHSGIPHDCIYQCIVFDMNMFLKFNSVCTEYMQKISHQELLIYHHFTEKHPDIQRSVNSLFDSFWQKKPGYELVVFGQFYHFFGLVFGNHYYLESRENHHIFQFFPFYIPHVLNQLADDISAVIKSRQAVSKGHIIQLFHICTQFFILLI